MADHSVPPSDGAPDAPDYDLDDSLTLAGTEQYRALFETTRTQIVGLLLERAATTSELADVLDRPKGTVGHHLKVLERAGLVRVVRTQRVRALEAKYYGRTARVFYYDLVGEAVGEPQRTLATAAAEIAGAPAGDDHPLSVSLRHARIPAERAEEWIARLHDLVVEFSQQPRDGTVTFALVAGLYPTRQQSLRAREGTA